ncbi:unnamed protein product [Leptosia nina]|uniref:Immunoglobulin domain-containing protein n=1 Tax=Leptosia nina TaxID=320188 RepID=A0AAV1JTZ0_9NEOP
MRNKQFEAYRTIVEDGKETILAFENEKIKIQCKSNFPMIYCGFVSPSGKRFSFTELSVHDGQCVHEIKAKKSDNGEWKCHIGSKAARLESIKKIQVRVVNQLAAVHPNVSTEIGKSATLSCATTAGYVPLSYCRFEPPSGKSFSIDSSVTAENPILKKYYYPNNRSLDRGDCCVTIHKVKPEDLGLWTCGAGLGDGNEHIDTILLDVDGMYTMSTASTTAVSFGVIIIAVTLSLLGYLAWKKRVLLGAAPQPEIVEMEEVQPPRQIPSVVVQSPSSAGGAESPLMSSTHSD